MIDTGGFPMVLGRFIQDPSFPTVTVYNHLDVQPAERPTGGSTPPFKLTRDDAATAAAALVRARHDRRQGAGADRALRRAAGAGDRRARQHPVPLGAGGGDRQPPLRGRPGGRHRRRRAAGRAPFATDSVVVSDTIWTAAGQPSISYGLRGPDGIHDRARDRRQGRPLGDDRRRRAQPDRRAGGADRRNATTRAPAG